MFKRLASFFTGGAQASEKILDSLIKGGDALVLTEEERMEYNKESSKDWLELQRIIAQQSAPTAVNRRVIAWAVVLQVIFTLNICVGLVIGGFPHLVVPIVNVASAFWLGEAFVSVIVFYFGTQALGKLKKE